jgi:hypothetical protein
LLSRVALPDLDGGWQMNTLFTCPFVLSLVFTFYFPIFIGVINIIKGLHENRIKKKNKTNGKTTKQNQQKVRDRIGSS